MLDRIPIGVLYVGSVWLIAVLAYIVMALDEKRFEDMLNGKDK